MTRIRVGVVDQGKEEKLQPFLDILAAAGADVTVLKWQAPRDAAADAAAFDALVLCGGDDVDARRWGEANHATVQLVPAERDEYEIAFARTAVERGVPLLGVCRGSQIMNVALGGTLEQHVPDVPGRVAHGDGASHEVDVEPGSVLARLAPPKRRVVNSFHHQAVGKLAPTLRVAARSVDGVVEAVEGPGAFCLGVQWHPEREGCDEPLGSALFRELVQAAEKRRASGAARSSNPSVGPSGRQGRFVG
jgi:putative glutamine amidotransferase